MSKVESIDNDPMDRFDPESRRLPGVPGVPVVLADGRTWHFAASTDRYRPKFEGDLFVGVEVYRGFPPPCDRPTDALKKAAAADPESVPLDLIFGAAASLLRKAHNLSAPETAALLHLGEDGVTAIISGLTRAFRADSPDEDLDAGLDQLGGQ